MKNIFSALLFMLLITIFSYCTKQDALTAIPEPEIKLSYISFKQDTIPVTLSVTTARKENVGSLFTTAIEGKLPDTTIKKNTLIIRVTGDSARKYTGTEIFASYTDSAGITYANSITDTINKVTITKMIKKKDGAVEGSFTIRVSNNTKSKTYLLTEGKFSTTFFDY
ncbi:hypothetical protein [Ferruginibacter sp.]|nr:hypothetical protein [Ferruginibacter sp.]